ncbi:M16 family metallopeptidase [Dyadobacter arcticus]|uniref:Zinc protease n=1 Tax=Dyadobacter arcticus TaxID=1078754 RepID=A0ABX0UN55_9BACT|nr:pitrilysin family protein [Dyadobacter arcticus]NIJ54409.1 zinc protease [Dyadobacter arcticus]
MIRTGLSLTLFLCILQAKAQNAIDINFEKFTLDNGLTVVFHIDRSDPVVAVALTTHVGSSREKVKRTGFAHMFEHLLFLESENLGKGGLDRLSSRIGGSGANGFTNRDITTYHQTVPNDALEKMLWAEADKLGYFINTVSDPVLAKEKQVVKNEKRQSYDNRAYGFNFQVIDMNLYPENHPYNWEVIGSLEDLQNATLQDVKDFYNRWYVPNNVTLVVAGDFDPAQAKTWVQKYFGEIKKGEAIPEVKKMPVSLSSTKRLFYEDNFAQSPQLSLVWPTAPNYAADSYPLEVLGKYLTEGKKAPFYKILVEEKKLTDQVQAYNYNSELAGQMIFEVRAYENVSLDSVNAAMNTAFTKFEKEGISESDLNRIKALVEVDYYNGISNVLGKAFLLAQYQIFTGDPGFVKKDISNILGVSAADVMRVYSQYIKGKNFIATSFVPKGQSKLMLTGSTPAVIEEEKIVEGAEKAVDASIKATYTKSPSSFDRTVEPPYGKSPQVTVPKIWDAKLDKGLRVFGIEDKEIPLVQAQLSIKGGQLLDSKEKTGVANLLAEMLTKGTKTKTAEQLEEAMMNLGTSITVKIAPEEMNIGFSALARNYQAVMDLVKEIILMPRWEEKELELARAAVLNHIKQEKADPNAIGDNAFTKILYGPENILSQNILGTEESLKSITMADLQKYYEAYLSPSVGTFHIVGDISKEQAVKAVEKLNTDWKEKKVTLPMLPALTKLTKPTLYFSNVPGAKQSVLFFGYPAVKATDLDYYPLQVMNYILGGGGFASRFTQQLREGKGYTYGIQSGFKASATSGYFLVLSGVRSNVTYESAALVKDILQNYGNTFTEQDLEITQSFLSKSSAREFETRNAKLGMLKNISTYNWPYDYAKQRQEIVKTMTLARIKELAGKYITPDKMNYVIVGDAESQLKKLSGLGIGEAVIIN